MQKKLAPFLPERTDAPIVPTEKEIGYKIHAMIPDPERRGFIARVHGLALNTIGLPFFRALHFFYPVIRGLSLEWVPLYFAKRWVAGRNTHDGVRVAKKLARRGLHYTLDILGEQVQTEADADRALKHYESLIKDLAHDLSEREVSVKLSQLGLALHEDRCAARVDKLLKFADQYGAFISIDMEQYALKDATLCVYEKMIETHENVGICLQAYLRDTREDLHRLIRIGKRLGHELCIRLCKGAYLNQEIAWAKQGDYGPPVFLTKEEVDKNFLILAEMMIGNRDAVFSSFATHNEETIIHILHGVAKSRISNVHFEFQMLYGIREDLARALARLGYMVRIYVPCGSECLPYVIRRLLHNPHFLKFLNSH